MSGPKGLWTKTARFIEAMEDASGPMDSYVLALGKRVEKLERDARVRAAATAMSTT